VAESSPEAGSLSAERRQPPSVEVIGLWGTSHCGAGAFTQLGREMLMRAKGWLPTG
jgi:hypothetical protein